MPTVLLIGGPKDGAVMDVETFSLLRVAVLAPRMGFDAPTFSTTYYEHRPVNVFGVIVHVMLHESLANGPERDSRETKFLVAQHLLSDKAKAAT